MKGLISGKSPRYLETKKPPRIKRQKTENFSLMWFPYILVFQACMVVVVYM